LDLDSGTETDDEWPTGDDAADVTDINDINDRFQRPLTNCSRGQRETMN
jgi:hypothetical protein